MYDYDVRFLAKGKEMFSILLANRSAVLFEMKQYKECLLSIEYALKIGNYPKKLLYKLYLRKAKCYSELENFESSLTNLELSKQNVKHSELSLSDKNLKTDDIKTEIEVNKLRLARRTRIKEDSDNIIDAIKIYDFITIKESSSNKIQHVAAKGIQCGTTIIEEIPFASSIDVYMAFCQFCVKETFNIIPCENCNFAIFCSQVCKDKAKSYHKYECTILEFVYKKDLPSAARLALRMITQKPLNYFLESEVTTLAKQNYYFPDDYNTALHLPCKKTYDSLSVYIDALLLILFLKQTTYFESQRSNSDLLTTNELIIAEKMICFYKSAEYNMVELPHNFPEPFNKFQRKPIGIAIYLNSSLFQHSCDPNVISVYMGNKAYTIAIKPIKKGDKLYRSKCMTYMDSPTTERKSLLSQWFDINCKCVACENKWFEKLYEREAYVSAKCPKCSKKQRLYLPFKPYTCTHCRTFVHIPLIVNEIMAIMDTVKDQMKKKRFDSALQTLGGIYNTAAQHFYPPHKFCVLIITHIMECIVAKTMRKN